ncbi:PPOX class F420-dependent oxidoreductase [Nocardia huaxiensis]|uniref:PPOX class F420-dependent oxidoreductase n=1 Tax=Nocardia huaxiensis TaxID=2755382 RepID=A0A7D6V6K9_9NOCA|nr:PPOX class F420-dependent oxidoreductase [Nocardia huaxiensis]QLY28761.1 PPOX class F420-dependent oxidoreductase [Nocardia huaxiensis]UFS97766.1 PPOX class F420-dependent oxidoreductase [Nocardia huaxiensis]
MATKLDATAREWLTEPRFWVLATLNPSGQPQLTPMWADLETIDGVEHIVVNTSVGRIKDRNLRRDPRLSLCAFDPENPYARMEIRGRAVGFIEGEQAVHGMDRLTRKYLGVETYPWLLPDETRVIVLIEPDYVHHTVGVEPFPDSAT